ncbi:MAG: M13 family metallopeptidase [Gammaproteobacteria bacterium]
MRALTVLFAALFMLSACAPSTDAVKPTMDSELKKMSKSSVGELGVDLSNMDRRYRPQDDFFLHVNGGWLEKTEIPSDRSNYGSFSELYDVSEALQREIIENAAKRPNSSATAALIGNFYNAYMDEEAISAAGAAPLRPHLDRVSAVRSKRDLMTYFGEGQKYGHGSPIRFWIDQDSGDTTRYVPFITQSGTSLPDRDYYLNDDEKFSSIRKAYLEHIERMFGFAGLPNGAHAARHILELETNIAQKQWERVRNRDRDATFNPMSRQQLVDMMAGVDMDAFLQAAGLGNQQDYIVRQPSFQESLAELINDTPLSVWRDYLNWHVIDGAAEYLTSDFVDADFDFYSRTLRGVEENRPRWKRAVSAVNGSLGEAVGKLYVEKTFKREAKIRMDEMVENLRSAFGNSIDGLEWMSATTKEQAREKLAKFTPKIGYPEKWKDYSSMRVSASDLTGNMMAAAEYSYARNLNKLGGPIDRDEWFMTPQTVNAYYNPSMNEIVFPAAILQPPFFNVDADDAVNYGAIGAVIGHEFSHGFDDQGRKSDGDGNLRDWWTEKDAVEFKRRADGLVAQYAAFEPLPGENVNGELTLGENIGDLAGLTMAYRAYQLSLGGKKAPVIGGYTGDQRFFLGWAQVWRREYREDELRNRLLTDPHSPSEYRVNGIVANMPEFHRAFNVKRGDELYRSPEEIVKIW